MIDFGGGGGGGGTGGGFRKGGGDGKRGELFLLTQMRYPSSASSGLTSQCKRIESSSDAKI